MQYNGLYSSVVSYGRLLIAFCLLLSCLSAGAQIHERDHSLPIDADSVRREFDKNHFQ